MKEEKVAATKSREISADKRRQRDRYTINKIGNTLFRSKPTPI